MNQDLRQRFQAYLAEHKLWAPGQGILLACSGGVDSMVLAHLLLESSLPFALAHCHFQLREGAADLDAALVENWAKDRGIAFYQTRFNTRAKAEQWGVGIQEAARRLRYEWLHQLRIRDGYTWVATAHHQDDQVETVLMNFFKGTGLAGMRGILPKTEGLIRPLLFADKKDLLQYAHSKGIEYRTDESNAQDDYLRNALRIHLIPVIEHWFPGASSRMGRTIDHLREAAAIYQLGLERWRKKLVEPRGNDVYLPIKSWTKSAPQKTIAYEVFKDFGFRSSQIPQILDLMESGPGQWVASATHRVIKDRDFLIITPLESTVSDYHLIESVPFQIDLGDGLVRGAWKSEARLETGSGHRVHIHPKALEFPLVLRRWKQGDYFYPLGMGGKKKKLSRFLIEKKLPLHKKDEIWVLESAKRIVWVLGWRLDERFKVLNPDSRTLEIEFRTPH